MKQMSLGESGFEPKTKRTGKREFFDEMNLVMPWAELVPLTAPHSPGSGAKGGRPPVAVESMLRIHFIQQCFNLSDPAMEEALYDMALFREFVGLDAGEVNLPDESTILRFRHLLEAHNLSLQILAPVNATLAVKGLLLKSRTVVDVTLIAAPSSTKNSSGEHDPEMHQTKKGNQWHFGKKAHIGVDADLGYQGVDKRDEARGIEGNWHVAMRPGKRRVLDKSTPMGAIMGQLEQAKARIRAMVEHPIWVIKRQFGHAKVR